MKEKKFNPEWRAFNLSGVAGTIESARIWFKNRYHLKDLPSEEDLPALYVDVNEEKEK